MTSQRDHCRIDRRNLLKAGAAAGAVASAAWAAPALARAKPGRPHLSVPCDAGVIELTALTASAIRVRVVPRGAAGIAPPPSLMLREGIAAPQVRLREGEGVTRLVLPGISCTVPHDGSALAFHDRSGKLILQEQTGSRRIAPGMVRNFATNAVRQGFVSAPGERLYGTGCFQDGHLNLIGLPRRLTQVNTQISLPVVMSSKGYGLIWHNAGMSELNSPEQAVALTMEGAAGAAEAADVTTATGNARVERREAVFEGRFTTTEAGKFAFLYDCGRKMASRHSVEIDGRQLADFTNLWLPPTASFFAELAPGEHNVRVRANSDEAPSLHFAPVRPQTVWSSPVAEAIDYIVIAGPSAAEIMAGQRELLGASPMLPVWAFGYVHCRERFRSSAEIMDTAREFRARKLPVDVMVQDWQYWGKHGWNAMRFDEDHYPDPAGLVRDLHGIDLRLMLSVWSKIGRETELGKDFAARGYYLGQTDWIDFFNPEAAAYYARQQNERLASLGIDAWWQDATEPENDDLAGRDTAAGPGEKVQLAYPLKVSSTVFEAQRKAYPDKRAMILTRCAFPGQQRTGAVTWSGDIGNDWETLRRQIPAGLNMAAAGYPYWTVDAGGFFRPGKGQFTDPAYRERFLRWFQYATFLPMQRVHGYMTDTEFWRYGEQVETISRQYLELRYRLLPYVYSLSAEVAQLGLPMLRPLVFDFPQDERALDQAHAYMFGPALHVAPVLAPGVGSWNVYLPQTPGGWFDLWTGEHRAGGISHSVAAPLERIPVHVRAGSVLPLGPVRQSTVGALGGSLDLMLYPGASGKTMLHEDDGLTYCYERGEGSAIPLGWDDAAGRLTLGRQRGAWPGLPRERTVALHSGSEGLAAMPLRTLTYRGQELRIALPQLNP